MRGELYCGYGEFDHYAPPSLIKELGELLKPCPVRYTHAIHKGADHGYALPDRDVFHKQGAERDWELIFAMFQRMCPPGVTRSGVIRPSAAQRAMLRALIPSAFAASEVWTRSTHG